MSQETDVFACDLTGTDLQSRGAEWRDLLAHVRSKELTRDGFQIVFSARVANELVPLVEAERSCCGWATWSCDSTAEGLVLKVTGPARPIGALAEAFGVTNSAPPGGSDITPR